jgi:hypothetical protein
MVEEVGYETRSTKKAVPRGHNTDVGTFTQHYGSDQRDAGLPMIRLASFQPATDDRVRYGAGTAETCGRTAGTRLRILACSFGWQTARTSWTATRTRVGYRNDWSS